MRDLNIRASADLGMDRMNAKIRQAQLMKVPYMLVVGDQEINSQAVSLRTRAGDKREALPVAEFIAMIQERIAARSPEL